MTSQTTGRLESSHSTPGETQASKSSRSVLVRGSQPRVGVQRVGHITDVTCENDQMLLRAESISFLPTQDREILAMLDHNIISLRGRFNHSRMNFRV
jgi:hypothetical protein